MVRLLGPALLAATLTLFLAVAGLGTASAQGTVAVKGSVVNGTGGGTVPSGLPVLLIVTGKDGEEVSSSQALAGETGRFQFDELPLLDGGTYSLRAEYAGVPYSTVLLPGDLPGDVRLTVYETTQDVSVVRGAQRVMVIAGLDEKEREIAVIEFVRLTNQSDRALLPDLANPAQISFLRFSLPPMARGLNVNSDLPEEEIIPVGTSLAVTSPVVPGEHRIDFSYVFPYRGDSVSYRSAFFQGADVYVVLVPDRLSQIRVAPLERKPPVNIQGSVYQAWEGRGFGPGQELVLKLERLPEPGLLVRLEKSITSGTFWQIAIPGALGVVLASLLLFSAFKAPVILPASPEPVVQPRDGGTAGRDELIREVADLDERFQRGEVPGLEYRDRRQRLKSRILEPRQQSPGGGDEPAAGRLDAGG